MEEAFEYQGYKIVVGEITAGALFDLMRAYPEVFEEGKLKPDAIMALIVSSIRKIEPEPPEDIKTFLANLPASKFMELLNLVNKVNPLFSETSK